MAKYRLGFVSNSSSSSFICKLEDTNMLECENCKKILNSLFTVKSAREYIVDDGYYESYQDYLDEYTPEEHFMLLDAVRNDETILYANAEYGCADVYQDLLDALGLQYEED